MGLLLQALMAQQDTTTPMDFASIPITPVVFVGVFGGVFAVLLGIKFPKGATTLERLWVGVLTVLVSVSLGIIGGHASLKLFDVLGPWGGAVSGLLWTATGKPIMVKLSPVLVAGVTSAAQSRIAALTAPSPTPPAAGEGVENDES